MVIPVMVHIPQLHGQPLCDIVASAASNVKFVGNAAAADTQYTGDVAAMMGGNEAGCAASAPSGGSGASDHPVQPAIIVHEDIIETWQHKKTGEKLVMRLARPDDKPLVCARARGGCRMRGPPIMVLPCRFWMRLAGYRLTL
jgi:hypothetical protein